MTDFMLFNISKSFWFPVLFAFTIIQHIRSRFHWYKCKNLPRNDRVTA